MITEWRQNEKNILDRLPWKKVEDSWPDPVGPAGYNTGTRVVRREYNGLWEEYKRSKRGVSEEYALLELRFPPLRQDYQNQIRVDLRQTMVIWHDTCTKTNERLL